MKLTNRKLLLLLKALVKIETVFLMDVCVHTYEYSDTTENLNLGSGVKR